jgi:hypothetical protein
MSCFVLNTNILDLIGLHGDDGSFIADATVTVTIKDSDGVELAGVVWPMMMGYVAASSGNYRAFLPASLPLIAKANYVAIVDADGGPDRFGHFEFHFKPVDRSESDA